MAVAVTDSSGNVLNSYVYGPYGNLYLDNETVANPWQFESGYQDGGTGLIKFGTRYYNPALGRWTQHSYSSITSTLISYCPVQETRKDHTACRE